MDDGKSIRYKDLYALFEQILEKTMRLEQRDWSESPVKVWVNTFKVFLDEYMLEYKPLDCTAVKVASIFSRSFKICELSLLSSGTTPGSQAGLGRWCFLWNRESKYPTLQLFCCESLHRISSEQAEHQLRLQCCALGCLAWDRRALGHRCWTSSQSSS